MAQFFKVGHFYIGVLGHYHVGATGFSLTIERERVIIILTLRGRLIYNSKFMEKIPITECVPIKLISLGESGSPWVKTYDALSDAAGLQFRTEGSGTARIAAKETADSVRKYIEKNNLPSLEGDEEVDLRNAGSVERVKKVVMRYLDKNFSKKYEENPSE